MPRLDAWEVPDLLASLADRSLLVYERQDDQVRFRLLKTVRQYALEEVFAAAFAAGRAMTMEQAVAYALDDKSPAS